MADKRSKALNDMWNRLQKMKGINNILEPRAINNVSNYIKKIMKGGNLVDDFDAEAKQALDRRQAKVLALLKQIIDAIMNNLAQSGASNQELNELKVKLDELSKQFPVEEAPAPAPSEPVPEAAPQEAPAPAPEAAVPAQNPEAPVPEAVPEPKETGPSREEIEGKIKGLKEKHDNASKEIGDIQSQVEKLLKEQIDAGKLLEESDANISRLEAERDKIIAEIQQLQSKKSELQGKLPEYEQQLNVLNPQLEEKKKLLQEVDSELSASEEEFKNMPGSDKEMAPEPAHETTEDLSNLMVPNNAPVQEAAAPSSDMGPLPETAALENPAPVPASAPAPVQETATETPSSGQVGGNLETAHLEKKIRNMVSNKSRSRIVNINVKGLDQNDTVSSYHYRR